jgi:hypothetical protein
MTEVRCQKYILVGPGRGPKICFGWRETSPCVWTVSLPNQQSDCGAGVVWLYRRIFVQKSHVIRRGGGSVAESSASAGISVMEENRLLVEAISVIVESFARCISVMDRESFARGGYIRD